MPTTQQLAQRLAEYFSVCSSWWVQGRTAICLLIGGIGVLGVGISLLQVYHLRQQDFLACVPEEFSPAFPTTQLDSTIAQLVVDISGAVEKPGVYQRAAGSRLGEFISLAGGFSSSASKQFVQQELNLAQPVADADKIYIPYEGEYPEKKSQTSTSTASQKTSEESNHSNSLVSLNAATIEQLDALPGIGKARAEAILAGKPYQSLSDLVEREILTEAVFAEIEPQLQL